MPAAEPAAPCAPRIGPTNSTRSSSDSGFGPRGRASTSTPLGITSYSPPNQRRPVHAAASETAIRALSWLNFRRAPSRFAIVFGQPLGRVGVEGADDGRAGERAGVPAQHRRRRLVDVDDVEAPGLELASHRGHRGGKRRQVRDGAVGGEPDRSLERDQVVGAARGSAARAVEHPAEAVRRIPRAPAPAPRGRARSALRRGPRRGG